MALPLPSFALPLCGRSLSLTLLFSLYFCAASSLPIIAAYRHFRYKSCAFIALPHSHTHTRIHTYDSTEISFDLLLLLRAVAFGFAFAFSPRPLAHIEVMSQRMQ